MEQVLERGYITYDESSENITLDQAYINWCKENKEPHLMVQTDYDDGSTMLTANYHHITVNGMDLNRRDTDPRIRKAMKALFGTKSERFEILDASESVYGEVYVETKSGPEDFAEIFSLIDDVVRMEYGDRLNKEPAYQEQLRLHEERMKASREQLGSVGRIAEVNVAGLAETIGRFRYNIEAANVELGRAMINWRDFVAGEFVPVENVAVDPEVAEED